MKLSETKETLKVSAQIAGMSRLQAYETIETLILLNK
jgi:hypothetical protein